MKNRCFGVREKYVRYHDEEWGVPVYNDQKLFEMLILEGAQAGLSWETILNRREAYRKAYHQFDPKQVAQMSNPELETLLQNKEIIRNRRKIFVARQNANVFLQIQTEFGSFSKYLWGFVDHKPIIQRLERWEEVPCRSEIGDKIAKDLKARGMGFVGPKIIYSYMQAVGLTNDHLKTCWLFSNEL
jgi:DNA-3-methyladenine glycosylase I